MIIEFFGLPGSGKTYTAKKLEDKNFQLVKFKSKSEKYIFSLSFIISHPYLSFYLFSKLNSNSNPNATKKIKLKLMRNILLLATMASYQKALTTGKVILDEGFFQIIHSIFENKKSEKEILSLLKKIPKPNILVIFDVPPSIRLKRLKEKPRQEFGQLYFNSWLKIMEFNDKCIKKFISTAKIPLLVYPLKKTNLKEIKKLKNYLSRKCQI